LCTARPPAKRFRFCQREPRMSNVNAVAAVEHFWREVWQPPQNPDAIDHLVADDFVLTSGGIDFVSSATFKKWVIDFQSKITHLEFDILETFQSAEGTRVASRWQIRGKNNGILGTNPDQRHIRFTGTAIWAVRHDGVLLHNWVERSAWELHAALTQPSPKA
jgi:predicted ester cyclase